VNGDQEKGMETPVTFSSGQETLFGTLHRVADDPRLVLMLHGWGGQRVGPQGLLVRISRALAEAGVNSFRFDFRGRGDSTGPPSATTLDDMISDALAAMDFLSREHGARAFRFAGLCSGGNVALGAASLRPESVDRIVAGSLLPFMEQKKASSRGRHVARILGQYAKKALRPGTWVRLLRGEVHVKESGRVLVANPEGDAAERERKRSQRDILADLTAYRGSLHLIYGTQDPDYPSSFAAYEAFCRAHHIPLEIHLVQGSNHNFYSVAWSAEVVEQARRWLVEGWREA